MSDVPMTRPNEVLAIHHTPYQHSSTFVQLDSGRILQCVFGGGFIHSDDGGLTWSKLTGKDFSDDAGNQFWHQCSDTDGNPVGGGDCALVKLSGKHSIGLSAVRVEKQPDASYAVLDKTHGLWFWRSDDEGRTWQPPVRMSAPNVSSGTFVDTFLRTASGRIIRPAVFMLGGATGMADLPQPMTGKLVNNQWISTAGHFFDYNFMCVYMLFSDDDGRTWKRNQDGMITYAQDWNDHFSKLTESSVTEVSPGKLVVFMRTGLGRLFQAWSSDNGTTWSRAMPTALAASAAPAQLRTLPNGHLLCVWNQESAEEIARGENRTRISSAISRDGGRVWEFFQNVHSGLEGTRVEPGPIRPARPAEVYMPSGQPAPVRDARYVVDSPVRWRGSYPAVLVLKDRVLVAHTSMSFEEHATEATLVHPKRVAGASNQLLKVLPLTWFYGGKQPADNPFLPRAYDPAKP